MSVGSPKTFKNDDPLLAEELNALEANILNAGTALVFPATANMDAAGFDMTGVDEVGFTSAGAGATTSGRIRYNNPNLTFHNGSAVIPISLLGGTPPVRFLFVSSTSCAVTHFSGRYVPLKDASGWKLIPIPLGGVAFSNGGLSANTLYYAYLLHTAGTLSGEFATTAPTTDTDTTFAVKTGDATRLLVGAVRTNASAQFEDSVVARNVITWYHRRARHFVSAAKGSNSSVASGGSYVEVDPAYRVTFTTWADEVISATVAPARIQATTGSVASIELRLDTATIGYSTNGNFTGTSLNLTASYNLTATHGFHTLSPYWFTAGSTGTWNDEAGCLTGWIRG